MNGASPAEAGEIDRGTAERWVDAYVRHFNVLPSESYERSTRRKLPVSASPENDLVVELLAILLVRPRFLLSVGATPEQIEWLEKRAR